MTERVLVLKNITKRFPGVVALDNVDFELNKAQVHALVGANGAGKSTLVNIIAGVIRPDQGRIILRGRDVLIENEKHAAELGISIVYQERSLVPNLSVADNIFAARQPINHWGFIDKKKLHEETNRILARFNLQIDPDQLVGTLSASKQQLIEIAKAWSLNSDIFILDEPTATITKSETEILFEIIKDLKAKGISIIYISHRLEEIFEIADMVTILRDGRRVGTYHISEIQINDIIHHMVGKSVSVETRSSLTDNRRKIKALEVSNCNGIGFRDVSFSLHEGEILGLAGLVGAGRSELARALYGVDPLFSGEIRLFGNRVKFNGPSDAIRHGIGYMPEDRKEQGLFLGMSVAANIAAPNLGRFSKYGWIDDGKLRDVAYEYVRRLKIVTPGIDQKVINLSGGNQQKVVLAAWLLINPRIMIVDEPTKGIDVGTKAEIYRLLDELRAQGTSIIVISSEFKELLAFTDRILVMWEGCLVGELATKEATEEKILELASGFSKGLRINA
ncbi:MAG: sugar ABC transporter ATP-binding protein [Firmicutes bacterium]|nr:sugar ABC transporter ATP-binding protein [Bacillota bacterium]